MKAPLPSDWLDALSAELDALATGMLGLGGVEPVTKGATPPAGMEGAYLGLISSSGSYQIGLASTRDGCQALARSLLALESQSELPASDVADAACEIVNILAGGVKRRLMEQGAQQVVLGLPTFFHGAVQPTERLGVAVAEVRLGALPAALLVVHPRASQVEAS